MLAYLVLARTRGFHRRELLVSLLWPETDDRRARNALSQALHALRGALGHGLITSRGTEELQLDLDAITCDAIDLEGDLDAGRPAEALDRYRGELLEGLYVSGAIGFERWIEAERARLRRRARDAARALADAAESAGNPVAAARWLERGLDISPSDETDVRRLMSLLDRVGDRAGALRAYDDLARHLRIQYDAAPSPETEQLVQQVRGRSEVHADTLHPPPDTPPPPAATQHPPPATPHPPAATPHSPTATHETRPPRLAVLSLQNLTGDPDQEYFADGLTETLITELARSRNLRVISRQSASVFKGSGRPLAEIARRLGADLLLEGSVLRAGDHVRVAAQLFRPEPEEHLWADVIDGMLGDVLSLQREIARAISREVRRRLEWQADELPGSLPGSPNRVDPRAYDEFLRGVVRFPYTTPATFGEILAHFQRASELDGSFAEAHAWIAFAWLNAAFTGACSFDEARAKAMPAVEQAVRLAPELGSVQAIRATALQAFTTDWAAVDAVWTDAVQLGDGDRRSYGAYPLFLAGMGRFDQAIAGTLEDVRLNPLGPPEQFSVGWAYFRARRYDEAVRQLTWTLSPWPDYAWTAALLGASQLFAGWPSRAVETCRRALAGAQVPVSLAQAAATLARAGEPAAARQVLTGLEDLSRNVYVDPYALAVAYAGNGDGDALFRALDRVVSDGSVHTWGLAVEVFFDPFRDDPRFDRVLRALHLPRLER